jgi:hypothetical protein
MDDDGTFRKPAASTVFVKPKPKKSNESAEVISPIDHVYWQNLMQKLFRNDHSSYKQTLINAAVPKMNDALSFGGNFAAADDDFIAEIERPENLIFRF